MLPAYIIRVLFQYCAVSVDGCNIEMGAHTSVGTPTYGGTSQTTYSCINSNGNCNYDVHVIGNYESNGHTGTTNVYISVSGEGTKPLILVFESYEPVNWILSIPSGVIIQRVLLVCVVIVKSLHICHPCCTCRAGSEQTLSLCYNNDCVTD